MKLNSWLATNFAAICNSDALNSRRKLRRNRDAAKTPISAVQSEILEDKVLLSGISVGQTINETIGTVGDIDQFEFTVASPTRLYVDTLSTYGSFVWHLTGPAGNISGDVNLQSTSPAMEALPGTYQITFGGAGDTTGAYSTP